MDRWTGDRRPEDRRTERAHRAWSGVPFALSVLRAAGRRPASESIGPSVHRLLRVFRPPLRSSCGIDPSASLRSLAMKKSLALTILAAITLSALTPSANAQGWKDRLKKKVEQRVDQRTDQAADKGLDKAEQVITCEITDKACADKARAEGKQVKIADASSGSADAAAAPASAGDGVWLNYDFKPGDRVLFYDDYAADATCAPRDSARSPFRCPRRCPSDSRWRWTSTTARGATRGVRRRCASSSTRAPTTPS